MEEWRNTAAEASVRSFTNINGTNATVQAIIGARQQYGLAAADCLPGAQPAPNSGEGAITGVNTLRLAYFRIECFSRFHAVLGNVFSLCAAAAHIGLQGQGAAPWWLHRWQLHHADAARHADEALRCLHSAIAHSGSARMVFRYLIRPPSPQAVAHAWTPAAEQLVRRVLDDLDMAEAAVERMRPAIVAQYSDAWMLLHLHG